MTSSSPSTARRALIAAAGVGALAAVTASILRRKKTPGPILSSDVGQHALFETPTFDADVIEVITDDGAKLHVRAYGPVDGQPIVLSHGWACSIEYWYPQINALAQTYRVIGYDQRGHGRSETGALPFTSDVLADDLAAVLEATLTGGKKAVLVGHSMGGISIMAWVGRHPEMVDKYASATLLANTATDSLVADSLLVRLPNRLPMPLPVGRAIIGASVPLLDTPLTQSIFKYATMSATATRAEVAFCENIVRNCHPRVRGGWGVALSALDIREGLVSLKVPTTVVAGADDRLLPVVHSRRLARTLDEAGHLERLIVLPDVGHMSTVEDADAINTEIVRLASL